MATETSALRTALLAGATGLVGRQLLQRLLASPRHAQVHLLLRRATADLPTGPKRVDHLVDFASLPPLPAVDDVFIALGTTIKIAGSQEAFRRVDFDAVVDTARAGRAAGATRLAIVSALGADAHSRIFYSRVKGEMQEAVAALGYASVVIAQPSMLIGDRAAMGQPTRPGEEWSTRLFGGPLKVLVPRNVRPIGAGTVAQALLEASSEARPGVRLLPSGEMNR